MSSSGCDVQVEHLGGAQARRPVERRAPPGREHRAEALVALQRQRLQRQPQAGGRRAGARALQADLAQVQVGLGEVRERRVVAIDALHGRIGEQHRAAPVGLQAVLVGVDDDGVALRDRGVRGGRDERIVAAREQREEAAVGAVDVQAHPVALAQGERLVDAIDGAQPGRAGGEHDGADVAARALGLHGIEVDAALGVGRAPPWRSRRAARTCARGCSARLAQCTMRLPGWTSRAIHSASRLAIVPLEVRWPRPGAGSPNMTAQLVDDLHLQPARPRPAVERVVVGVDEHRRQVAGHRHRVGRLEHLARVARVEERVVVGHPLAEGVPRGGQAIGVRGAGGVRLVWARSAPPRRR